MKNVGKGGVAYTARNEDGGKERTQPAMKKGGVVYTARHEEGG